MSDARTYTAAQLRQAQRDAFEDGAQWRHSIRQRLASYDTGSTDLAALALAEAQARYPDPPPRPRVARDPYNANREWRFVKGAFETRAYDSASCAWSAWHATTDGWAERSVPITPDRVDVLAALKANPTEPVPPAAAGEGAPA